MQEPDTLEGRHESLWIATTPRTDYDPLDGDRRVDVAVVGGGIVGVTAAAHLAEAGHSVALLEAGRVVEGTTGHTTAKLTSQHGLKYRELVSRFDEATARKYAQANERAIDEVHRRIEDAGIDADFERLPAYTYVDDAGDRSAVRAEADVAGDLGLPATYVEGAELPFEGSAAVRFDRQAQFHPRKYLLALAAALPDEATVYEQTEVTDVDPGDGGDPATVETDGGTVTADDVVLATGFPLVDPGFYFARLRPKRSYVLVARLAEQPPNGMYYRATEPYYSVRPHPAADGPVVLIGGEDHKPGDAESTVERYRRLQRAARADFDVESIEYRWSTQDYESVDGVPFVGEADDGLYVATGFGGWGMTNGTVAGRLLADLIDDLANPWAEVYDPTRLKPLAGADRFLRHNVGTAAEFVGKWVTPRPQELEDLPPGEADVFRRRPTPVAAYRDEDGDLHATSAVCPHMRCLVEWNDAERTWDCPCHGSRFTIEGEVIEGPANEDLERFD